MPLVSFLVDSGADDSFIDESLAKHAGLPLVSLAEPREVLALDGRPLARITHRTDTLTFLLSGNHREQIQLYLIPSSSALAILGSPWLACHNPQIDWSTGSLTEGSVACHARCLHSTLPPALPSPPSAQPLVNLSAVPEGYHDLKRVFSKLNVLVLPPHCPYNCAIDLRVGDPLPTS